MPSEAVDLISRLLQYSPSLRITAVSIYSNMIIFSLCRSFLYSLCLLFNLRQLDILLHSVAAFGNVDAIIDSDGLPSAHLIQNVLASLSVLYLNLK